MKPFVPLLLPALLLFVLPLAAAPPRSAAVTDLGATQGEDTFQVNNRGQVVGSVSYAPIHESGETTAFLWTRGRRLALKPGAGFDSVVGCTLNDRGEVAGSWAMTTAGAVLTLQSQAFLWRQGRFQDIGAALGEQHTEAAGIDDHSRVVGRALGSDRPVEDDPGLTAPRAFVYANGKAIYLGPGEALAVSSHGLIAGRNGLEAVLWQNGAERRLGVKGRAAAINERGQILINGGRAGQARPFLWQNGRARPFLLPNARADCAANALNDTGEVVGTSAPYRPKSCALLWRGGRVYDLNALLPAHSGWVLKTATGINNKGQIVGAGIFHGKPHAYLLTLR